MQKWFLELIYRSAFRVIQNNNSEAIIHTCTRFVKSLSIPTLASILSSTSPASIPLEWVPPPYYTLTPPPPHFWEQKPQWWPLWLDGTVALRWMPDWIRFDRAPKWWPDWMNNWIVECMPYRKSMDYGAVKPPVLELWSRIGANVSCHPQAQPTRAPCQKHLL